MELIYARDLLKGYKLKDGDSVLIDTDSFSIVKYFHELKKINLIPDDNYIFDTLEIAGFLREQQMIVSVNGFPPSYEPGLIRHDPLKLPIKKANTKGLTWKTAGVEFYSDEFVLGKDFPITDERTGILGYLTNRKSAVIFNKLNGDYIEGYVVGKLKGDEEYLARPNKWLTDLLVFKANIEKGKAIAEKKFLFCRPLGAVFLPLNRKDIYTILLKLKIRSSGYPAECYDY
ncbi:hypothetical protein [Acidianus sp. HS-5]|uniref:hypothetical protein n=1 Tax=Acidianus sp. HS-5 TaxID=2886040 RepID=UPI001F3A239B|nr:hypothetical protein [Acidianus sp. HS-5]BDC17123.1 hypothetical protein HS5_00130 [Acidianus sp. HS-5]